MYFENKLWPVYNVAVLYKNKFIFDMIVIHEDIKWSNVFKDRLGYSKIFALYILCINTSTNIQVNQDLNLSDAGLSMKKRKGVQPLFLFPCIRTLWKRMSWLQTGAAKYYFRTFSQKVQSWRFFFIIYMYFPFRIK